MDSEFHDALRSDVSRLETALGDVRQDLNGLRGCQDHCHRLDNIQETVGAPKKKNVLPAYSPDLFIYIDRYMLPKIHYHIAFVDKYCI